MKKFAIILVAAVLCATIGVTAFVSAQDAQGKAPKGEKGILVGDVISVVDYAMYGRRGEEHVASGQLHAEHHMPIAIIEDETNEVWMTCYRDPAPASHLESANDKLYDYVGKKVAVQGLKFEAEGVNLIRVSVVSEY
jgi:hypothetical protein